MLSDFTVTGLDTDTRFWHLADLLKETGKGVDFINGYVSLADAEQAPETARHWVQELPPSP